MEIIEELELREMVRKAHLGDMQARLKFNLVMEEASDNWDSVKMTYMEYLRQQVLKELLDEYAKILGGLDK